MMKVMDECCCFGYSVDKDWVIEELAKFYPFVFDELCHNRTLGGELGEGIWETDSSKKNSF